MDVRIDPHPLSGTIAAIPSKSMAHRLLICAALCQGITDLVCPTTSDDIEATISCLTALGATVARTRTGMRMVPITVRGAKPTASLDVGESGSTLRFLLPVIAALGTQAQVTGHGRLAERPLGPLVEQLRIHGARVSSSGSFPLTVEGKLRPGRFRLPGSVSSQFASGLLLAAPLLDGAVEVAVEEPVESAGYIDLTIAALASFGVSVDIRHETMGPKRLCVYTVAADAQLETPGTCVVEGDWSNAAFWLAAGALGTEPLMVSGLDARSRQGDRAALAALALMGARAGRTQGLVAMRHGRLHGATLDVSGIPDLVPPLAAVASYARGTTRLTGAGRLRLKESDRLATVSAALTVLGGKVAVVGDELHIEGVDALSGGTVDAAGDHRIAMMAAICAASATGPTVIKGASCVNKSYPTFFDDFRQLGGIVSTLET